MTTVYLIRHGETDWNMQGRWQGHVDVPLNEVGYRQARLLANRLARDGVKFEAIYSSDLSRAYQTAWEIGAVLKVPVQLLPALREIDTGRWSGLTTDEVRTQFPDEWAQIMQGHDLPRGGGETIAALQRRVVTAVEAMVAQHRGHTLAFVTHGGCIRALLAHAENLTGSVFGNYPHIGNTSVSILEIGYKHWRVKLLNDMRHLEAEHEPSLVSTPPDDAELPTAER
ncbi:MAG: phosphoglycerate mutase [Chloroflexus sp.]|uniref:histidine phosphatase family protein n=1 Tax=Chloroflexus sp. TaxID=1904827 RepID=UPI0021DDAC0F|nr:histidine phosphatase family protein [Chloroflexus sp.]GIV89928.1 MAG: phosphoglycerate mutase [Chloroflexus sp.]